MTDRKTPRQRPSIWTPSFILLFIYSFLSNSGFFMTMPVLPRYAVETGMTLSQAGVLTGIFSIVAIFARPVAGLIADSGKKKSMLLWFSIPVSAAAFCYGFATGAPGLYASRIIHGACYAISSTIQIALTTQLLPRDRMGEGMSMMSMSQVLAMSIAPNLGLTIGEKLGNQTAFFISGGLIAAAIVCVLFLPKTVGAAV